MTETTHEQDHDQHWDYRALRLPPGITRISAATQLTIHAEFAGWNCPEYCSTPTEPARSGSAADAPHPACPNS